ncbi:hydrophobin-like protein [Xylaria acuta]|nr:hydrophobin-like protein [Xylaria acuta]
MQTSFVAIFGLLAAAVSAAPTENTGGNPNPYIACAGQGLFSVAQCCATDVLGVADLDCHSPSAAPFSVSNFRDICADGGQRARCCVIPILGQAVLCVTPTGLGPQ